MKNIFRRVFSVILLVCIVIPLITEVFPIDTSAGENVILNGSYEHVVAFDYGNDNNLKDYDADTFSYRDSYFSGSSYDFSYDIAQLAFSLAFAGCGTSEKGKSNTANLEEMFLKIGCNSSSFQKIFIDPPKANTIGSFIASKKNVTIDNKKYRIIFVVIRGGNYYTEWAGNFNVGFSGEHNGFAKAANTVYARLTTYIKENCADENLKIMICGYSRASATANLLAKRLDENVYDKSIWNHNGKMKDPDGSSISERVNQKTITVENIPKSCIIMPEDIYTYGFEVPMGAVNDLTTQYKGNKITNNIFSIVNDSDFVTKVAPAAYGFRRYGRTILVPNNPTTTEKKNMKGYFAEYFGKKNKNGSKNVSYQIGDNQSAAVEVLMSTLISIFPKRSDYVNRLQGLIMELWESAYSSNGDSIQISINENDISRLDIVLTPHDLVNKNNFYSGFLGKNEIAIVKILYWLNYPEMFKSISISTPKNYVRLNNEETSKLIKGIIQCAYSLLGDKNVKDYLLSVKNRLYKDFPESESFIDVIGVGVNLYNDVKDKIYNKIAPALAQGHYPELCSAWIKATKDNLIAESASDLEKDNPYHINLKSSSGGTVSGSGASPAGTWKIIKATPKSGYEFVGWYSYDGNKELSLPNPYHYYVDSDLSMMAKFVKKSADTRDPYFDQCTEIPGVGKIKVTSDSTNMKALPCSDGTKPSERIATLTKGTVLTFSRIYKNSAGNYWLYASYNGKNGYVYSGDISPVKSTIQLTFENGRFPDSSFSRDSFFYPGGTIKTNGEDILKVAITLYSEKEGKVVQTWQENIDSNSITTSYSFEEHFSKIDDVTQYFKYLPNGNYKITYAAQIKTTTLSKGVNLVLVTAPQTVKFSQKSFTVTNSASSSVQASVSLKSKSVNSSYAVIKAKETVSNGIANDTDRVGIRIYDAAGNLLKHYKELPQVYSDSRKTIDLTYTIGKGKEVDLVLKKDKTYKYEVYAIVKGHEFTSALGSFKTTTPQTNITPVIVTSDVPITSDYTVFSQKDPRWGSIKYGNTDQSTTIAEAGCCPLSIVNGVYYLTGIFIEPTTVCDFAVASGCRSDINGTSSSLYQMFLDQLGPDYGVMLDNSITFDDSSWNVIIDALSNSKVVFVKNSHHYMVLADYDSKNDLFLLLDSSEWKTRKTLGTGYAWLTRDELRGKDDWCDGHSVVGNPCWIMSSTNSEVKAFMESQNLDAAGYYCLQSESIVVKKAPISIAATVTTLPQGSIVHVLMSGQNTAGELWYKTDNGFVYPTVNGDENNFVMITEGFVFEKKDISLYNASLSTKDYVCFEVHPIGDNTLRETTRIGCIIYTKSEDEYIEVARAVDNTTLVGRMYYNISQTPKASNTKFYDSAGNIFRFIPGQTYYYRAFIDYSHNGVESTVYSADYASGSPYLSFIAESLETINAHYTELSISNITATRSEISYRCQVSNVDLSYAVSKIGVLLFNENNELLNEVYTKISPTFSGKNDYFYENNIPISDLMPDTSYKAQVYAIISGVTVLSDYVSFTTLSPTDIDCFNSTAEDAAGFYYVCSENSFMYSAPNSSGAPISLKVNGKTMSSIPQNYIVYADQIGINKEGKAFFHLQKRSIGFYCDQIGDVYVESDKLHPLVKGTYKVVPFATSSSHLTLWQNENLTGNNGNLYKGTEFIFTGETKGDLGTASYNGKTGWLKIGYSIFVSPAEIYISYDSNGGYVSPETQTEQYGVTAKITEMIPKRDGYDFLGWSENINAENADYAPGSDFLADHSTTLFAIWVPHTHNFSDWIHMMDATCVDSAMEIRTCSACDAFESRIDGDPLGHIYANTVYDSTCLVAGFTLYTCSRCGESYVDSFTVLTEHIVGDWTMSKEPSCTISGEEVQKCSVCEEILNCREVSAFGHDFSDSFTVDIEPTSTTPGQKSRHCSRCDAATDITVIDPTGPTFISGDVDNDNEITMSDVLLLRKSIAGIIRLTPVQLERADIDRDGDITMSDVLILRKIIAGIPVNY